MLRLFLGNIPHSASEDDIRQWIEDHGFSVTCVDVILDRMTGVRRGFCFVTLADHMNLDDAIDNMHGRPMSGRAITVSRAVPMEHQPNLHRRAG